MKEYRVIWFDDEHKTLIKIREKASIEGIKLIGYDNAKDGIKELHENIRNYDAAILDGFFYKNPGDEGDAFDDSALGEVSKELIKLEYRKKLPWYILSGQESFTKEENSYAKVYKEGKVYDKMGNLEELWFKLKNDADVQPETQARFNNPEIFEIFNLGYLPESLEENILDLLIKPLPTTNSDLKDILTNIRSIHESCFLKLESINVIDKALTNFRSKLNHLSGNPSRESGWKPRSNVYQTEEIKNLHQWIYFTCGTYIHYLEAQHYDSYMISNYAVESLRSGLLEILLWFKKTYSENI